MLECIEPGETGLWFPVFIFNPSIHFPGGGKLKLTGRMSSPHPGDYIECRPQSAFFLPRFVNTIPVVVLHSTVRLWTIWTNVLVDDVLIDVFLW